MSQKKVDLETYKDEYRYSKYINRFTRGIFFLLGDSVSLLLASIIAFLTLSPFSGAERPFPILHTSIITASIIVGLTAFRMYKATWRYVSLRDLVRIICGITIGGLGSLGIASAFFTIGNFEIAFTVLVAITAILFIGGFRISKRMYFELVDSPKKETKYTVIFGGKSEGEQILRDIIKNEQWNFSVHAIFDDRVMSGLSLHGVKILGGKDEMIEYIKKNPVEQLIVAFPEYPKKNLKGIIDQIKEFKPDLIIKILPSFHSLTDDPVGFEHIRDISIEDVLGREPVKIDMDTIKASIDGKTVMVTGGGGSIGSELVRQCANLRPSMLIALDVDETELFHIENEFKGRETEVIPCVASVADYQKMNQLLARYKPQVIFHAAAYKHVPMMESFPEEAIKVNVGGTQTIASLACKHQVEKFIMVSTDKAVNPTNVMGATKRVAEEICMAYNENFTTKFVSVRFGNVLGSRGSVVPLFIEQIKRGGPITVTDPEMKRYFMTIPEAVLLVMQAGSMGSGGEVFVLDMGEPVKIMDMAKDLIRLHNLEPDKDIEIEISGLRPGEKLYEELLNAEEGVMDTEHKEIFKAICSRQFTHEELEEKIDEIFDLFIEEGNENSIRRLLKSIVPTYSYKDVRKTNGKITGSKQILVD
ncbi:polysaccharide biosynthesis protein [Balneolaceae bacterium YR4-1]|uniref:Polysaccharide biosynthesis protein n=1 Tax=Halalkalibaculum roseum TaxID=2709311 RepID=A0A6M1SZN7_9BACT|nr:nucleoside-diphosphate sugar epimerase/dehydratase [Halalkalibaculum roseum]NGP76664.1 polysaccharide biosynthesis protein [Halalkalibaculum roseum]